MTTLKERMKDIKSLSYLVLKREPWCHMLTVFQNTLICCLCCRQMQNKNNWLQ